MKAARDLLWPDHRIVHDVSVDDLEIIDRDADQAKCKAILPPSRSLAWKDRHLFVSEPP